jgi:hypothetical protein
MIKNILFDIHGVLQPKNKVPSEPFTEMCSRLISEQLNIPIEEGRIYYNKIRKNFDTTSYMLFSLSKELYKKYLDNFKVIPTNANPDERLIDY